MVKVLSAWKPIKRRLLALKYMLLREMASKALSFSERVLDLSRWALRKGNELGREIPLALAESQTRRGSSTLSPAFLSWQEVLLQIGDRSTAAALLTSGAIGGDFPRTFRLPAGKRILVLAAHHDDETIGAAGTLILAARQGAVINAAYLTDGATAAPGATLNESVEVREAEARRVWRRIAGTEPVFLRSPNRAACYDPTIVDQIITVIREFEPDVLFVPSFLEQPLEHRRVGEILALAARRGTFDFIKEIWGYQTTTRFSGNIVVDITSVYKKKYAVNALWTSQNAYLDYAHLAMGRDIAASFYLKGISPRPRKGYAECFLVLPYKRYLRLQKSFRRLPATATVAYPPKVPPPDFFIVGMQKSGTFWLTALLDAHPMVRCFPQRVGKPQGVGEAHLFDMLALMRTDFPTARQALRQKLGGALIRYLPKTAPASENDWKHTIEQLRYGFSVYCHNIRVWQGKPIVGEKTTEYVHHLNLLKQVFPGAMKICILRDPRDRAVSFYFHQLRKSQISEDTPLDAAYLDVYAERVEKDYLGLLTIEQPYHLLTYEALWQDPVTTTDRLLEFLCVRRDSATVRKMVDAATFSSLAARPAGTENRRSHFRKGVPGDWRDRLDPSAAQAFVERLEPLTRQVEDRLSIDLSEYRS